MPVPGELDVRVENVEGRTLISVAGDIDVATVDQLEQALTGAIEGGATDLVLDLAGVPFLDSTGVGAIVVAEQRLRRQEAKFALRSLQALPLRVLEIGGLTKIFTIETEAP